MFKDFSSVSGIRIPSSRHARAPQETVTLHEVTHEIRNTAALTVNLPAQERARSKVSSSCGVI
jgi:hypothetical protein